MSDDLSYPSLSRPTSLDLNTMGAFGGAGAAGMERQQQQHSHHSQQRQQQEAAVAAAAAMEQPSLFHEWNADKFIEVR